MPVYDSDTERNNNFSQRIKQRKVVSTQKYHWCQGKLSKTVYKLHVKDFKKHFVKQYDRNNLFDSRYLLRIHMLNFLYRDLWIPIISIIQENHIDFFSQCQNGRRKGSGWDPRHGDINQELQPSQDTPYIILSISTLLSK